MNKLNLIFVVTCGIFIVSSVSGQDICWDYSTNSTGAVSWDSTTDPVVAQVLQAPADTLLNFTLFRPVNDSIIGTFTIQAGNQDLNTTGALSSIPFNTSTQDLIFDGINMSLVTGSNYTFFFTLTSGQTNVSIGANAGGYIAYTFHTGSWRSDSSLSFKACFQTAPSPSPNPSVSPSTSPSITPSRSRSPPPTSPPPSFTPSNTPTRSTTPTPSRIPSSSNSPSVTPSVSMSQAPTPTSTPSSSSSVSPSVTPTSSPSSTPAPSLTPTSSASITPTPSLTPSISRTPSASHSPSVSPTSSMTPSFSPSPSASPSSLLPDLLDTYTEVILHMEGDVNTFDQQEFKDDMVYLLDIYYNMIEIVSVTSGSVIVKFKIYDTNTISSAYAATTLENMVDTNSPELAAVGIVPIDIQVEISGENSQNAPNTHHAAVIATVVIVVFAVAGSAVVGFFVVRKIRNNRQSSATPERTIELNNLDDKDKEKERDIETGTSSLSEETEDTSSEFSSDSEEQSEETDDEDDTSDTSDSSDSDEDSESESD